ncbi:glutathione S-transferase family protein [Psychromarinibacter sp. C21-152]|uniref:Glutathione S-transferase family protein n=1 Tax=Psychromarinibacter sediminicola TaxID=3033385 RepID=A0AAE3NPK0_9RHOB|nr:glutathione S-transferase family protein [Psychromarinibacter sediminicola]MDF0601168.1 glutathione S-transferase family protein [Psychromarinibacter sediminicola]
MLTLYHAPRCRSTRIVALLDELGARDQVSVEVVGIPRQDGSGGRDPRNPHPEGKVPLLVHDGVEIWESTAIALYLTELFPEAGLGRPVGAPDRGRLLSWLAWYGDVLEPVMVMTYAQLDHPALRATFRGMEEAGHRLSAALSGAPYLMGADYTVADLICASAFQFAPQYAPDAPGLADWVARCADRPAQHRAQRYDAELLEAAGG